MALVGLTPYIVNGILNQVEDVFLKKHTSLTPFPDTAPMGVGDEAYSVILPPENEKAFMELVPDWAFPKMPGMYIEINTANDLFRSYNGRTYVHAPFKKPHAVIYGNGVVRNAPGIETAEWEDGQMILTPMGDGSAIKLPALRDFVNEMTKITAAHTDVRDEVEKAKKDMATFLAPHRTLQKAVKAFGPALMEYVPEHIKVVYNRAPEPRKKRAPKPEVVAVDTEYLTAAAIAHKLKLN